jgi:hypothetical protein
MSDAARSGDRSCASGWLQKQSDTVKRRTHMPQGLKNWGPEADALRRAATEQAASAEREAARAEELGARATRAEQQISHEGQSAGRHDEKAAELEEKL